MFKNPMVSSNFIVQNFNIKPFNQGRKNYGTS